MTAFESSFEGDTYNAETFDEEFFVDNVTGIIEDIEANEKKLKTAEM
jgi:hypothetical protein